MAPILLSSSRWAESSARHGRGKVHLLYFLISLWQVIRIAGDAMKRAIFFVPSLWLATLCLHQSAVAQEFSFRRAVELALQHSGTITLASAEEERARQTLKEGRNLFLPQLTVGSGLAATYGFPLSLEGSSPSIINVNEQNFLINPAQ